MNYKKNFYFIIAVGILSVALFYILLGFLRESSLMEQATQYEEYQISQLFDLERSRLDKINTNLYRSLLSDTPFQEALAAQDRDALQTKVDTIFRDLSLSEEYLSFLTLHLIDDGGVISLGSHTDGLPCNNDHIGTKEEFIRSLKTFRDGFAVIDGRLTFLSRQPIRIDKDVVAVLETGVSARTFIRRFTDVLGGHGAVVLKRSLALPLNQVDREFPGYVLTLSDYKGFLKIPGTFDLMRDNQSLSQGESIFRLHTDKAVQGIGGEQIGHFLLLIDHSQSRKALVGYALTAAVVTLILLAAVFYLSGVLLNRITRKIEKSQEAIKSLNAALEEKAEIKRKKLNANTALLDTYKKAVDESNIVSKTDPKGVITYVNEEFIRISGYSKEELIGRPHNIIRHPDMSASVFEELWRTIKNRQIWKGVVKNRKKDGSEYLVDSTIVPVLDPEGEIVEYIAIRHDITDLVQREKELQEIKTDHLTGLGNRSALKDELENGGVNLLAILNIDNYREIKDFYGVEVTDGITKELASALEHHPFLKPCGLFRITSEQFALLYKEPKDDQKIVAKIGSCLRGINKSPIVFDGYEIYVDLTAGIAYEADGERIFRNADLALKEALRQNIDLFRYDDAINILEEYEKNIFWTSRLKKAIATDQLATYFQPIVHNETGRYEKFEALIRMVNEDGSVTSPFFFLDMAKRSRLYPFITQTIIRHSVEAFKHNDREFSINLTADDIHNPKTVEYLEKSLLENALAPRCVLEITESEEIKDYKRVVAFIKHFKDLGCKIAIDDFGSGYSNFNYIADLGADYIKIDGSLIKNIDTDPTSEMIVRTIITFAKSMNIETVAEFVSSESIFEKVKSLGVDYSQGFYFAEPSPTVRTEDHA